MRTRWTEPALRDLEAIGDYIARQDRAAADRIIGIVFAHVDRLETFPHIGRPGRVAGTRELVVAATPFVVPYRVQIDHIQILAVLHGARRWPDVFD